MSSARSIPMMVTREEYEIIERMRSMAASTSVGQALPPIRRSTSFQPVVSQNIPTSSCAYPQANGVLCPCPPLAGNNGRCGRHVGKTLTVPRAAAPAAQQQPAPARAAYRAMPVLSRSVQISEEPRSVQICRGVYTSGKSKGFGCVYPAIKNGLCGIHGKKKV